MANTEMFATVEISPAKINTQDKAPMTITATQGVFLL
jgi:hypothetical protein